MLDGTSVGSVFIDDESYDIKLISTTSPVRDPTDLEGLFLLTAAGEMVPMSTVVTLELDPPARWVVEYYPVDAVRSRRGGRLEVDLVVANDRWLQRLLLRLAPHVRVLAPAAYAEALTESAERTLQLYT